MLMQAQPVFDCCQAVQKQVASRQGKPARVLYMSPQGRTFDQPMAKELAREQELILLCGHYEGIDARALEEIGAEEISIGDFVLTGGELPAMVMIDAISRMVPGVLGNSESADTDSADTDHAVPKPADASPAALKPSDAQPSGTVISRRPTIREPFRQIRLRGRFRRPYASRDAIFPHVFREPSDAARDCPNIRMCALSHCIFRDHCFRIPDI